MVEMLEAAGAEEGKLLAVDEDLAENASDEGARYLIR